MPRTNCRTPGCRGRAEFPTHRGLCPHCFKEAKAEVEAGRATWDGLAAAGLVDPPTETLFQRALRLAQARDAGNQADNQYGR